MRNADNARAIALSIDGGHVRSVRSYQVRSFEVILAQVSNDEGKRIVLASMPAEAHHQREQLRGELHGLGATLATPVTILRGRDRSVRKLASVQPITCWTGPISRCASTTSPRRSEAGDPTQL
jgi:hypothetical protein